MNATPTPVSTPVKTIAQRFSKSLKTTHAAATEHHLKGLVRSLGDKANKSLADIDAEDLTAWLAGLPAGLASSTTDDHLKSIIALFKYGIKKKACTTNVAKANKRELKSKRAAVVAATLAKKADENELDAAASEKSTSNDSIKSDESPTAGKIRKTVISGDSAANARLENLQGDSANHAASGSDPGDSRSSSSNHPPAAVKKLAICEKCRFHGGCHHNFPADIEIPATGKCPGTGWAHSKLYNLAKLVGDDGKPLIKRSDKGRRLRFKGDSFCAWFWSQPEAHHGEANEE
jgi:hypothetical protein